MIQGKIQGQFTKKLQTLVNKYQSKKVVGYRIEVPPELIWWYYQEYGTAVRGEPGKASGVPYDIKPVIAKALRIPQGNGSFSFVREIKDHPGIPARYSVKKILPELEKYCKEQFAKPGIIDDPKFLAKTSKECAEFAIKLIAESLDRNLDGIRRIDGKLEGDYPGEVFEKLAKVVEIKE
jgi:hypothetical protein